MKWANRDINVAEWAKIPKFNALDDLVAPLRLLELFFMTLDMVSWYDFGYIKLYSRESKH